MQITDTTPAENILEKVGLDEFTDDFKLFSLAIDLIKDKYEMDEEEAIEYVSFSWVAGDGSKNFDRLFGKEL